YMISVILAVAATDAIYPLSLHDALPIFFNRALSADEIAAIYHAGSAGKCQQTSPACLAPPSGLVSWWPGNGNGTDVVGGNNATEIGRAHFRTPVTWPARMLTATCKKKSF